MIYLWIVIPTIIAIILPDNSGLTTQRGYSPIDTAVFTYFGVVLCIVFSGFVLIYSLKVIEPRIVNKMIPLISKKEINTIVFLKYNFELFSTFVIILVGLLITGVQEIINPNNSFWETNNTIIILLLLLLCSFVLSYGIIYRGMFREHIALKRTLFMYEKEIEKYSVMPIFEVDKSVYKNYANELENLQKEIDKIWSLSDIWGYAENQLFERFLGIFKIRSSLKESKQNNLFNKLINADFIFENELTNELINTTENIKKLELEIIAQQQEISWNETKKVNCEKRVSDLEMKVDSANKSIFELEKTLHNRIFELKEYFNTLKIELKNAYNIGKRFKNFDKTKI